ncbi:MAG: transposase [Cephaloticoccus sp.]|nr:transposase [Cephaloticoccus sp.]
MASARRRRIVADKGFDSDDFRASLRTQRILCCIPQRRGRRHSARFHRGYYRHCHQIESFFGRIKIYRRISTRYDKFTQAFLGFVTLKAILDWLTH